MILAISVWTVITVLYEWLTITLILKFGKENFNNEEVHEFTEEEAIKLEKYEKILFVSYLLFSLTIFTSFALEEY